jgi:hypothetical protein
MHIFWGMIVSRYLTTSEKLRFEGYVARMGERRDLCRILVGKYDRKRLLGRTRRRWEDNIKMDLKKLGCGCMDWIDLGQGRDRRRALVNAVIKFRVP